jgi:hypothetical protein
MGPRPGGDFKGPTPTPRLQKDPVKPGVALDPDAAREARGASCSEGAQDTLGPSWTLSLGGTMIAATLSLGALMDVVVWLRGLGLGKYEAAFRENEIDETVLPNLTAEDLKDLGVGIVGHRRKLLDAIAALRTDAGAKPPGADAATTSAAPSVPAEERAERRQVTVMFSDLVGSTALSARMDPEDLREVISAYQKCVAETVQRFGGFVAKYMGDGVLVYFGYPQAHEHDAERAVRAGLKLVTAVSDLKTHAKAAV